MFLLRAARPISHRVGPSVRPSVTLCFFCIFGHLKGRKVCIWACARPNHYSPCPTHYCPCPTHYCPCPTARDRGCRVYALFNLTWQWAFAWYRRLYSINKRNIQWNNVTVIIHENTKLAASCTTTEGLGMFEIDQLAAHCAPWTHMFLRVTKLAAIPVDITVNPDTLLSLRFLFIFSLVFLSFLSFLSLHPWSFNLWARSLDSLARKRRSATEEEKERESERERERERERDADRQTVRQTDRQTDWQKETNGDKQTVDIQTNITQLIT